MARKLAFKKWKNAPHCETCGVPWTEHLGIASTCRALQNTKHAGLYLAAENRRLKEFLSGAMAFRLLVYLSVLPAGHPHTIQNILRALAAIRRKKRGESKPIRRKQK